MADSQAIAPQALIRVENGTIVQGEELRLAVASLRERALALKPVTDSSTYAEAMELCASAARDVKMVEAIAEPELAALRNRLNDLRAQRDKIVAEITGVVGPIEQKARAWRIAEQDAAKREEAQINKGKRPEQRVTVAPDVPPVPGKRVTVRYDFEVVDISKIKRGFLCPDDVKIRDQARKDKDPAKTEKTVGGIRVTRS